MEGRVVALEGSLSHAKALLLNGTECTSHMSSPTARKTIQGGESAQNENRRPTFTHPAVMSTGPCVAMRSLHPLTQHHTF